MACPRSLRTRRAPSTSPPDSSSARLTSIIPAAVSSRNCFIFSMLLTKALTSPLLVVLVGPRRFLARGCCRLVRLGLLDCGLRGRIVVRGGLLGPLAQRGLLTGPQAPTAGHAFGLAARSAPRFGDVRLVGGGGVGNGQFGVGLLACLLLPIAGAPVARSRV